MQVKILAHICAIIRDMDLLNYGAALKYAREEKGLSQSQLAEKTGISHQNISRWESGKIIPSIDFCVKLADFYGITLDELIGRTTE